MMDERKAIQQHTELIKPAKNVAFAVFIDCYDAAVEEDHQSQLQKSA